MKKVVFLCDPKLNKECAKTDCFLNNGECKRTSNYKYSIHYNSSVSKHLFFTKWPISDTECVFVEHFKPYFKMI